MLTIAQRLAAAVQHHEAGRLADAETLYSGILDEMPRHAHALHLMGVLAHQKGRYEEAVQLIGQALAVQGPQPVFLSNLASACLALGRLEDAESHSRAALRLSPRFADAHNNLGVALRRQGRFSEAELAFREAVRISPRHIDALSSLGAVLQRQSKLPEALAILEETVRLAPRHAQARNDLGGTLLNCQQHAQAERHLREAIRLRPDFAQAFNNLGLALRGQNQYEEALHCFREASRLDPNYTVARNNLGFLLEIQGRIPEAVTEFQETLRRAPNDSQALACLGKLAATGHYQLTGEQASGLEELMARETLPEDDRCRLHFALAAVRDREGAYSEAFEHCRQGNELRKEFDRRRGVAFDLAAARQYIDLLIAHCTPAYFERVKPFGLESELPIFIVGMMRSGTTLTEQILASHSRIRGAGELPDIAALAADLPRRLGSSGSYPACLAGLDAAATREMGEQYLQKLRQIGGEAVRVADKNPFNFLHLGIIATVFPNARIIHCTRDARDTCLSCYFQNFSAPHPFTTDLRHLGQYYREYERLMAHWSRVLPVPIFELAYEEMTADQEQVSRRLVEFCGLEWDERCLRFNETERVVRTASVLQVRQPMYRSSVSRWKRYEAQLQPLLEELGARSASKGVE